MKTIALNYQEINLEKLLSIVPEEIKNRESASYFVFIRFSYPELRGSNIHDTITRVVRGYFSPKVEPVLLVPPGVDISDTPRNKFDFEIKQGVKFLIDIKSHKKMEFTVSAIIK